MCGQIDEVEMFFLIDLLINLLINLFIYLLFLTENLSNLMNPAQWQLGVVPWCLFISLYLCGIQYLAELISASV